MSKLSWFLVHITDTTKTTTMLFPQPHVCNLPHQIRTRPNRGSSNILVTYLYDHGTYRRSRASMRSQFYQKHKKIGLKNRLKLGSNFAHTGSEYSDFRSEKLVKIKTKNNQIQTFISQNKSRLQWRIPI